LLRQATVASLTYEETAVKFIVRTSTTFAIALLLAACAFTPITQDELYQWGAINVGITNAEKFRSAGLTPEVVDEWQEEGLFNAAVIIDWTKSGYTPVTGGPWVRQGFDLKSAKAWGRNKFTVSEARAWRDAGFSVRRAVKNRKKGLSPVR
jgi:hypothetical protein